MFDPAQILLIIFIIILIIVFVVLSFQVYLILKDLRQTISKTNKVLDNTAEITESVANPLNSLSSLIMGLKSGATIAGVIKGITDAARKETKDGEF